MLKIILTVCLLSINNLINAENYNSKPKVQAFIQDMLQTKIYSKPELQKLFSNIEHQDKVLLKIAKPFEDSPWHHYEKMFVQEKRINSGLEYWQEHHALLSAAQNKFKVPAEIIVAIIGIESFYGANKGNFPVFDTLATLAFNYAPREQFFTSELKHFLLLVKEEKMPIKSLKGSYAGAMGKAQFIASSYRNFAVDFTGNGQRDLINNNADAIGSVANYFQKHGWQADKPIVSLAKIKQPKDLANSALMINNPKPSLDLSELKQQGIHTIDPKCKLNLEDKVALLPFENKNAQVDYWLGANNFYVITRYNHSNNYAMAVVKLAEALRSAKNNTNLAKL